MATRYTKEVLARAVSLAVASAKAHAAGETRFKTESAVLDLATGGYCLRAVRQWFEAALGIPDGQWEFASPSAKISLEMMDAAGIGIGKPMSSDLLPGDILGKKTNSGTFGHIMLYVGNWLVAENTSADDRGTPRKPGTKLTVLDDVWKGVQTVYRLGQWAGWQPTDPVKIVWQDGDKYRLLTADGQFNGTTVSVPVRSLAEALGFQVEAHLEDGKVYVLPRKG